MRSIHKLLRAPHHYNKGKVRVWKRLAATVVASMALTSVSAKIVSGATPERVEVLRPSSVIELASPQKASTPPITLAQSTLNLQVSDRNQSDMPLPVHSMQFLDLSWGLIPIILVGGVVIFVPLFFGGLVVIGEREVGVVVKKFAHSGHGLPPGRLIALEGEAGYQADTLAPGWHWGYWPWQYNVRKESVTVVPQGEIALIVAADGASIPPQRILGKIVPCDNFQDARKFLKGGGEKGRQLGILTAGTYRINTAFNGGGRRGLQQQVLLSGSWNLNPWFVGVEQVAMTEIPIGYVGVVISYIGKAQEDVSGAAFTHGNLVNPGHKGVWVTPLYPGKHPLNTRVLKIELVPTTNIVLNWSGRTERHSYDSKLSSLTVRSKDGFGFDLEVAQIIHVGALDAPKVISRVGAMQNLVDHVLQPTIGNYFRNSAQAYTVLDFLTNRSERQAEAADYIKQAIRAYDIQAIDTLIGDILPPAELMMTQTDRKIAEEQRKTYEVQQMAQSQRQLLVRETALADIQQQMVKSEQGVKIAELKANAQIKEATGEAESIRVTGNAKAEAYHAGVVALGSQGYTALQLMQIIGDRNVRVVPDVAVSGNGSGAGLVDGLLGMMLRNQNGKKVSPSQLDSSPPKPAPVSPSLETVTKTQPPKPTTTVTPSLESIPQSKPSKPVPSNEPSTNPNFPFDIDGLDLDIS